MNTSVQFCLGALGYFCGRRTASISWRELGGLLGGQEQLLKVSSAFSEEPESCSPEAVPSLAAQSVESSPVIHLVTDAKGNVLHEVHVQMQELPISEAKALTQEVRAAGGALPSSGKQGGGWQHGQLQGSSKTAA